MEAKINIVEILKDKPQGTKLYSSACGKCKLEEVDDKSFKISFYNSKFGFMNGGEGYLDKNGKLYDDGECVVFPSKEMRDWRKFAWKPGDVLVNKDGNVHIIFDGFEDDTYKNFHGKNYLWEEGGSIVNFEEDEDYMQTSDFNKANKEDAQEYIYKIEKILGGKLNRETMEIEKTQPEFKDGDILYCEGDSLHLPMILILKILPDKMQEYAYMNNEIYDRLHICCDKTLDAGDISRLRYATEGEKQHLFNALAKKGKAWDAGKKEVVDLKPKCEFKPMDLCLMKYIGQYNNRGWELCQYAYTEHRVSSSGEQRDFYHAVGGEIYAECIPYKGNEHLLGTKKSK